MAAMEVYRRRPLPSGWITNFGLDVIFHFQAELVMEPDHFRLKTIVRHPNIKPEQDALLHPTHSYGAPAKSRLGGEIRRALSQYPV